MQSPHTAAAPIDEYAALVAARKTCRICIERNPGRLTSGAEYGFDPDVVSYWEQWVGHKAPKLLLIGQDFGNVDYFVRNRGRDAPGNATNDNLQKLLAAAGIETRDPPAADPDAPVFATNSILCLKRGRMNAPILASWVNTCADAHLAPLLGYLRSPIVVGMGSFGWRAVRRVLRLDDAPRPISQAAGGDWTTADGIRAFAVGHPGPLGLVNRPWSQQLADWRRVGEAAGRF